MGARLDAPSSGRRQTRPAARAADAAARREAPPARQGARDRRTRQEGTARRRERSGRAAPLEECGVRHARARVGLVARAPLVGEREDPPLPMARGHRREREHVPEDRVRLSFGEVGIGGTGVLQSPDGMQEGVPLLAGPRDVPAIEEQVVEQGGALELLEVIGPAQMAGHAARQVRDSDAVEQHRRGAAPARTGPPRQAGSCRRRRAASRRTPARRPGPPRGVRPRRAGARPFRRHRPRPSLPPSCRAPSLSTDRSRVS